MYSGAGCRDRELNLFTTSIWLKWRPAWWHEPTLSLYFPMFCFIVFISLTACQPDNWQFGDTRQDRDRVHLVPTRLLMDLLIQRTLTLLYCTVLYCTACHCYSCHSQGLGHQIITVRSQLTDHRAGADHMIRHDGLPISPHLLIWWLVSSSQGCQAWPSLGWS